MILGDPPLRTRFTPVLRGGGSWSLLASEGRYVPRLNHQLILSSTSLAAGETSMREGDDDVLETPLRECGDGGCFSTRCGMSLLLQDVCFLMGGH